MGRSASESIDSCGLTGRWREGREGGRDRWGMLTSKGGSLVEGGEDERGREEGKRERILGQRRNGKGLLREKGYWERWEGVKVPIASPAPSRRALIAPIPPNRLRGWPAGQHPPVFPFSWRGEPLQWGVHRTL